MPSVPHQRVLQTKPLAYECSAPNSSAAILVAHIVLQKAAARFGNAWRRFLSAGSNLSDLSQVWQPVEVADMAGTICANQATCDGRNRLQLSQDFHFGLFRTSRDIQLQVKEGGQAQESNSLCFMQQTFLAIGPQGCAKKIRCESFSFGLSLRLLQVAVGRSLATAQTLAIGVFHANAWAWCKSSACGFGLALC